MKKIIAPQVLAHQENITHNLKVRKKKHFYALEITQPLTCQNNNGPFLKKGSRVDGEWRLPSAKLFCDRFMKTIYIM